MKIPFEPEDRSWGAHAPRVWLGAPRVQAFRARRRGLILRAALALVWLSALEPAPSCPPLLPLVTVTAPDANAAEVGPDTGAFRVYRSGGNLNLPLTVYYTLSGTATNGTDYQTLPGWVQIPGGATWANVTVAPIADTECEGQETVVLTLVPYAYYDVGTPSSATVTIADLDSDCDDLPDWWEWQHFGSLAQGADDDYDGDGVSNLLEYRQGANPTVGRVADTNNVIGLRVYTPLR